MHIFYYFISVFIFLAFRDSLMLRDWQAGFDGHFLAYADISPRDDNRSLGSDNFVRCRTVTAHVMLLELHLI